MSDKDHVHRFKRIFQEEQKRLHSVVTAFSVATMLLIIQGSVSIESSASLIGAVLLAASIPIGVFGYLISLRMLGTEEVPPKARKIAEDFFTWTILLAVIGFLFLLSGTSELLAAILLVSLAVSIFYFSQIMKAWPRPDTLQEKQDGSSDDRT